MKIICPNCGENKEHNFELSYNYDLNGVAYCTCKNCKSKFVYQDGESSVLGKYISDRSKFFSVLETAKLNGDYAGSPTSELKKLVANYSAVAEVDPIYHWYKIEIITNNFTDYSKAAEARKEFLKISSDDNYFVAKEDETRFGQYSRRYAVYIEEINSRSAKKKKKKKRIAVAVGAAVALAALAGGVFGAYSCYSKSIEYTLNLNYGEADGSVTSVEALANKNIDTLPSEIEYGDKYYLEFTGWYTQENCGGIKVSDANGKTNLQLDKSLMDLSENHCIQLYAGYIYKSYTVTFYSADGQSVLKTQTAVYNTPLEEISEGITYGDWTVLSWSQTVGGNAFAGNIVNDTQLFACSRGVNITLDSAGGNAVGMDMVKVGDKVILPVPERQYYEFLGWSYGNTLIGTELIVPESKISLVAQWKKTHFEVNYDTDGVAEIDSEILRAGSKVTLPNVTRQYYELSGWTCDGKPVDENFVLPERDVVLVANWVRTHYTVTFDTNGGSLAEQEILRVGQSVSFPVTSRDYYRLDGWKLGDTFVDNTLVMPDRNIVLVAQWVKTHYSVSFNYSHLSQTEVEYVLIGEACTVPQATREGYDFLGWYSSSGNVYKVNITPTADTVLTTRWEAKKYNVTYNVNGGVVDGGDTGKTVTYGSWFEFPVPSKTTFEAYTYKYSKGGSKTNTINYTVPHYFEGWYTSANGGRKLTDRNGVSVSSWNTADNTTVYAHWTPLTVKYSSGDLNVKGDDHSRNLADIIDLKSVLKYTPAELRALGYTQITIDMFANLKEVDDGYQELLMSNSPRYEDVDLIWSKKDIEHTGGDKDTSSWTHYFTVTFDLSKLDNMLYFFVSAHGSGGDDWILNYLDIYFTVK